VDDSVAQSARLGDLLGRARPSGGLPDVLVLPPFRLLGVANTPLGHALASRDQVDQGRDQREQDQTDDPGGLRHAGHVPVPEQIEEDLEHHHQVRHEGEADEDEPDHVPERHRSIPSARPGSVSGSLIARRRLHLIRQG
jgi:hypothetical protein